MAARPRRGDIDTMRKITLRIPEDLLRAVEVRAIEEERTINAQILWYLRRELGLTGSRRRAQVEEQDDKEPSNGDTDTESIS